MDNFDRCKKRQEENYKGEKLKRCIEKTSEHYMSHVAHGDCHLCIFRQKTYPTTKKPSDKFCPHRLFGPKSDTCGLTAHTVNDETCNRCEEETTRLQATSFDKVKHYYNAIRTWVANGKPTRTQEEVDRIHDEYCVKCDMYDKETNSCKNCGCKVSKGSFPLLNKLKMATETCPLGLWN